MAAELHIFAVPGIPDVAAGADLGVLLAEAVTRAGHAIEAGDVFVVAQKIVSKAEGALVRLDEVVPSPLAVIISDTFGRPWREGVVNVALGVAGLRPLIDYRGCMDHYGRPLQSTVIALADELAGAAEIVTRKTGRTPVAIVRGAAEWSGEGSGRMLLREAGRDLFR